MAQEAHEAPVGGSRSSSSTSRDTGMWESPRQMRAHTPFPSWIPYAGTLAAGAGLVAAADSSLPSERCPDDPDRAWNQSAPSVGARDGGSGYRGNYFQSLLDSKNVTPEMFEDDVVLPAASSSRDYLGVGGAGAAASDLAAGPAVAYGLLGSVDPYYSPVVASSAPPVDHETASSPLVYSGDSHSVVRGTSMMGCMSCYDDHEEKRPAGGSQRQGFGAPAAAFLPEMIPSRVETKLQSALGYLGMVSERLESSFGVGVVSLPDAGSFSDDYNSNRLEQDISPGVGGSSSGSGAATRRKSDGGLGGNTKKSKQEASPKASSPPKPQVPKVKVGEKITALQQIVSPFGKTDTSSVLFETIEYIKFLHEQIRMFSEPYMTKSTYKGHIRLRGEEKEEESGTENGLWGRGLCLVPVSLTSQAYHDDTLPDCWAPAYRGCLYR